MGKTHVTWQIEISGELVKIESSISTTLISIRAIRSTRRTTALLCGMLGRKSRGKTLRSLRLYESSCAGCWQLYANTLSSAGPS